MLHHVPNLSDLWAEPGQASAVPPEAVPEMLGELERLKAVLWARLVVSPPGNGMGEGDRLLTADEAALKLSISKDWLYRHKKKLPFFVSLGREVRFSERGIDRWIQRRAGR